jgi:predicted exporter
MTEIERRELEDRERRDEWSKLWKFKAVNKFQLGTPDEVDNLGVTDFIFGDSEDEVMSKAERLKTFLESKIAQGVEQGIEERLKQGWRPSGATGKGQTDDFATMTPDQLRQKAAEVSKMSDGPEKRAALKRLMDAQVRVMRG